MDSRRGSHTSTRVVIPTLGCYPRLRCLYQLHFSLRHYNNGWRFFLVHYLMLLHPNRSSHWLKSRSVQERVFSEIKAMVIFNSVPASVDVTQACCYTRWNAVKYYH